LGSGEVERAHIANIKDRQNNARQIDPRQRYCLFPLSLLVGAGVVACAVALDDRMNHLAYRDIEDRSCWAGRDQGGLAKLKQVDSNIPLACGVKLARRIDARPPQAPGLESFVLRERAGIQKLALWGFSSTKRRLIDRVQQSMAGQPAFSP